MKITTEHENIHQSQQLALLINHAHAKKFCDSWLLLLPFTFFGPFVCGFS